MIIDTPPVGLLPDAGLMAAMADVAVLVVGAAKTPFDVVQRTVDTIGRDKLMGVVLNRAEESGIRGGSQYHVLLRSITLRAQPLTRSSFQECCGDSPLPRPHPARCRTGLRSK